MEGETIAGPLAEVIVDTGSQYTSAGLVISSSATLEQLGSLIHSCCEQYKRVEDFRGWLMWALGDILNHAEGKFADDVYQLVDPEEFPAGTLADAKWVAKAIPVEQRRPPNEVSWSKHREVASIKNETDRSAILGEADTLTIDEIRERKAAGKPKKKAAVEREDVSIENNGVEASVTYKGEVVAIVYSGVPGKPADKIARMLMDWLAG